MFSETTAPLVRIDFDSGGFGELILRDQADREQQGVDVKLHLRAGDRLEAVDLGDDDLGEAVVFALDVGDGVAGDRAECCNRPDIARYSAEAFE
jgi:hypothetical protein